MNPKSKKSFRVLVGEFLQETNSFNPIITDIANFQNHTFQEGMEIIREHDQLSCELNGMFTAIHEAGGETIPAFAMRAQSGGMMDDSVLDFFTEKMLKAINVDLPIDGVFLVLHGATQTTKNDDACGKVLERIRKVVGKDVVISASCDLHANTTQRMLINADFICGYQTYPHEDMYETGYRAARLGMKKILGEQTAYTAATMLPMIVPAAGYSTTTSPFKDIVEYAKSLVEQNELIDVSIFQMQPWLDVYPAASTVLTIATDVQTAKHYSQKLARLLFDNRKNFWPKLWSVDEVIDLAEDNSSGKPVILADSADSPNAGAVGDSVAVLLRLLERNSEITAATIVNDSNSVSQAMQVGVGNKALFRLGAYATTNMPGPAVIECYVKSLHDGKYRKEELNRGMEHNIGRAAVLSVGNIDILVCGHAVGTGDPQIYRHFGIEPTFYQLLVVKANTSFRASYESIASKICFADTPGVATSNLKSLDYKRIPKSHYPFIELDGYKIPEPVVY